MGSEKNSWISILKKKNISIVVPVYNEGKNLISNIKKLLLELEGYFESYEVIVVSDGSDDLTSNLISEMEKLSVNLMMLPFHQGKGFALRSAFAKCSGDFIFFIDGDMEIHPKEIRIFLGLQAIYNADLVIGSKRHPQSNIFYPWYRRLFSWVFHLLVSFSFDLKVTDTQVGLKLMRAQVIHQVLPYLRVNGYGADLELLAKAKKLGFSTILEAPIEIDYFLKRKRMFFYDVGHMGFVTVSLLNDYFKIVYDLKKMK